MNINKLKWVEIKKIYSSTIVKAFIINIVVMFTFMLLFETTAKSDDYDICNVLYGGVNGEYSPFLLYCNVLLGYILKFMICIFPNFSWYFLFQYLFIFISFTTITTILLKRNGHNIGLFLVIVVLIYSGYECYIRVTFTKTSGSLILAGYIYILYLIEKGIFFNLKYIYGLILVLVGCLYRNSMFQLVTFLFFSTFLIFCYDSIKERKKDWKNKLLQFVSVVLVMFFISKGLNLINNFAFRSDTIWDEYLQYNTTRSALLDYGIPNYRDYQDEYEKIGVSQNDYEMWFSLSNIADPDLFTTDLMKELRSIYKRTQNANPIQVIRNAFVNSLSYLMTNTMFYLFAICTIILLYTKSKNSKKIILILHLFCFISYCYMYYIGRTQHHVDIVIYMTASVILLYYCNITNGKRIQLVYIPASILFLLSVYLFYDEITTSSYYGMAYGKISSQKEYYHENYKKMNLLSEDSAHMYILGAHDTNISYPCFSTFDIFEKGFYHNIFRLNQYTVPVFRASIEKYKVRNPLKEIVDNDIIYYCLPDVRATDIKIVWEYIRQHYNSNAQFFLVKHIEGLNIYRFTEKGQSLELTNIQDTKDEIVNDITFSINTDNSLSIQGYAFVDGTDSYAQNIYIELKDKYTEDSHLYFTTQEENFVLSNMDKSHGKYSSFYANIELDDFSLDNLELNIILENEHGRYRLGIVDEN